MSAPRHVAAWTGTGVLVALTVLVLIPPGRYVVANLHNTQDWQTNHAHHVAAARALLLMAACAVGGGLLTWLLTRWSPGPVTVAGQALAAAAGAFVGSLLLTVIGGIWLVFSTWPPGY